MRRRRAVGRGVAPWMLGLAGGGAPLPPRTTCSEPPVSMRSSSTPDSSISRRISRTSSSLERHQVAPLSRGAERRSSRAPSRSAGAARPSAAARRHRARLEHESSSLAAGDRPLDVLVAAEVALHPPAELDAALSCSSSRHGRSRRSAAPPPAVRARRRPARTRSCLAPTVPAEDLAGHLADAVLVGRHLAADDGQPEAPARVDRDHARVAADRVAGEHHARHLGVDHLLHRHAHRRLALDAHPLAVADGLGLVEARPAVAHRGADLLRARAPTGTCPAGPRRSPRRCPRRSRWSALPPPARRAQELVAGASRRDASPAARRALYRVGATAPSPRPRRLAVGSPSAKPGGTGIPAAISSPRLALLPPKSAVVGGAQVGERRVCTALRPRRGSSRARPIRRRASAARSDPRGRRAGADHRGQPVLAETIAAWDMIPPMSVTVAPILEKIGAHAGEVIVQTRISPARTVGDVAERRDHPRRPLDLARRGGRAAQLAPPSCARAHSCSALRGDAPEHHRRSGRSPPRASRRARAAASTRRAARAARLRRATIGGQCVRPERRPAGRPGQPQLLERLHHLVARELEDVLAVLEEAVRREQRAELADLVEEARLEPVVAVELVLLDVGEDRAREPEQLLERRPRLLVQQRAVLRRPAGRARAGELLGRALDVLARAERADVPDRATRTGCSGRRASCRSSGRGRRRCPC